MDKKNKEFSLFLERLEEPPPATKAPNLWQRLEPHLIPYPKYFSKLKSLCAATILGALLLVLWQQQKLKGHIYKLSQTNQSLQQRITTLEKIQYGSDSQNLLKHAFDYHNKRQWQKARQMFTVLKYRQDGEISALACYQLANIAYFNQKKPHLALQELTFLAQHYQKSSYIYPAKQLTQKIYLETHPDQSSAWEILQKLEKLSSVQKIHFIE